MHHASDLRGEWTDRTTLPIHFHGIGGHAGIQGYMIIKKQERAIHARGSSLGPPSFVAHAVVRVVLCPARGRVVAFVEAVLEVRHAQVVHRLLRQVGRLRVDGLGEIRLRHRGPVVLIHTDVEV